MKDLSCFAQRLRQARLNAKMTQQELSDRSEVHQVSIARLESGVREPSWVMVQKLARALNVPVTVFVDPAIIPPIEEPPRRRGRPRIYPQTQEKPKRKPRGST